MSLHRGSRRFDYSRALILKGFKLRSEPAIIGETKGGGEDGCLIRFSTICRREASREFSRPGIIRLGYIRGAK